MTTKTKVVNYTDAETKALVDAYTSATTDDERASVVIEFKALLEDFSSQHLDVASYKVTLKQPFIQPYRFVLEFDRIFFVHAYVCRHGLLLSMPVRSRYPMAPRA